MVDVAAVFGLSGVGKSWLISRFVAQNAFVHVQASQLLRDAKAAATSIAVTAEDLRKGTVLDNQEILIHAFRARCAAESLPVIFDGHCVVDSGEKLIEIPVSVINALRPSGLIFIAGDPKEIVARRLADRTRVRPVRTDKEIDAHQRQALLVYRGYCRQIGLKETIVQADDEIGFTASILKLVQSKV